MARGSVKNCRANMNFLAVLLISIVSAVAGSGLEELLNMDNKPEAIHVNTVRDTRILIVGDSVLLNKIMQERDFERNWMNDISSSSAHAKTLCVLPDNTMLVCIVVVAAYMLYIIAALLLKPNAVEELEEKNNQGLKALLEKHEFGDSVVPVEIRKLYTENECDKTTELPPSYSDVVLSGDALETKVECGDAKDEETSAKKSCVQHL